MFFGPVYAPLKVISREIIVKSAVDVTEADPIAHWLFCTGVNEPMGLISAPVALSHSS